MMTAVADPGDRGHGLPFSPQSRRRKPPPPAAKLQAAAAAAKLTASRLSRR